MFPILLRIFDILPTLGWLSLCLYIYTHYIIVYNIYIYVEGEREKDTTESSTIDGDLSMCVCVYVCMYVCIYIYMSHRKNPGNIKYVLDGHWFMEKLMEIVKNTR